jgi:hypothetical protein
MGHILVLQWPGSSLADFDELVRMEDELAGSLSANAIVDGHDFGAGEMNIFVFTDHPARTFAEVKAVLSRGPRWLPDLRAAYREDTGDEYTVLWPPGLTGFEVT